MYNYCQFDPGCVEFPFIIYLTFNILHLHVLEVKFLFESRLHTGLVGLFYAIDIANIKHKINKKVITFLDSL